MWEHSEQFVYNAVSAWIFVIAKSFDAFNKGTVIKDFGVEPLFLLESLGLSFVICDWWVNGPDIGENALACSQG